MLQALVPTLDPKVAFAFGAGVATFFAPCAYPLLPGYVAYFLGTDDDEAASVARRLGRGAVVAGLTVAGFVVVFVALVGVALAVGTRALRNVAVLELVVGALLVVLGIAMATGRFDPSRFHVALPERRRSPWGFFLFGVVYAAAAAGCTAPVFLGIAGFALASGPVTAVAMFGAYAAGMSVLMLGVTLASALGKQALIGRLSMGSGRITRVAGVVLVIAGLVQIHFFIFEFNGLQTLGLA